MKDTKKVCGTCLFYFDCTEKQIDEIVEQEIKDETFIPECWTDAGISEE